MAPDGLCSPFPYYIRIGLVWTIKYGRGDSRPTSKIKLSSFHVGHSLLWITCSGGGPHSEELKLPTKSNVLGVDGSGPFRTAAPPPVGMQWHENPRKTQLISCSQTADSQNQHDIISASYFNPLTHFGTVCCTAVHNWYDQNHESGMGNGSQGKGHVLGVSAVCIPYLKYPGFNGKLCQLELFFTCSPKQCVIMASAGKVPGSPWSESQLCFVAVWSQ